MNYTHDDDHQGGSAPIQSSVLPHHQHPHAHHQVHHLHHHEEVDDGRDDLEDMEDDLDGDHGDMGQSHMGHDMDGQMGDEDEDGMRRPRKATTKRRTKSAQQLMMLMSHFHRDPKPKKVAIKALVLSTGLTYPEICRWFRNQRLRSKQAPHMPQQNAMQVPNHSVMSQLGMSQGMLPEDLHKVSNVQQIAGLMLPIGLPVGDIPQVVNDHNRGLMALAGSQGGMVVDGKEDKVWRASSKFRRTRDTFLNIFSDFPKGSAEREQLIKDLVRIMGRADRDVMQTHMRPRGPYRGSADPALKMTTKQERAKEVWVDMERRFGAHGRMDDDENPSPVVTQANGLDANMIEGLKVLFKPHRDYLFAVARELEVTDMLKPEVETELKKKFAVKQQRRQELERQKRDKRKIAPVSSTSLLKSPVKRVRTELTPPPSSSISRGQIPPMPTSYLQHDPHGVPYGAEY